MFIAINYHHSQKKIPAEIAVTVVNDGSISDTASFIVRVTDD